MANRELAFKWFQSSVAVARARADFESAKQSVAVHEAAVARTKKAVEEAAATADLMAGVDPALGYAAAVRRLREAKTQQTAAQDTLEAVTKTSTDLFEELVAAD